jgi:hypothetical protein
MRIFVDTEFDQETGPDVKLISLGAVAEDGRTFYAEADWVDLSPLSPWMQENVVAHLSGPKMSKSEMWEAFRDFAGVMPEWWGYCCAYDYLMICQLHGGFMGKPDGWPYYMNELSQLSADLEIEPDTWPIRLPTEHHALYDASWNMHVYDWLTAQ